MRVRVDGKVYEIDAAAEARQEHQAHDRGRRRPPQGARGIQAAPRRIVRDRAAPRRRPRDRGRDGRHEPTEHLFSAEIRVPDLQLLAARARAAALLVQQSDGRVPALRRPGRDHVLRSEARRRVSAAVARVRRDQGLGPAQPVLLPDAAEPRQALSASTSTGRSRSCPSASSRSILYGSGEREDPVHVPVASAASRGARARVRGHHPQPRAPLSRDRFGDGARGARQVSQQQAVPRMRRHAAAARGAPREGRRRRQRARDLRVSGLPLKERDRPSSAALRARRPEGGDRRPASSRRSSAGCSSSTTSASTICRSTARPRRFPAARRSASASRRRSARASPA